MAATPSPRALQRLRSDIRGRCGHFPAVEFARREGHLIFEVVAARDDEDRLVLTFEGVLRVDNPYRHLWNCLEELGRILPERAFTSVRMDFTRMRFANDNCFYVIMDIVDAVYLGVPGAPVTVRRGANEDWQQETLPVLLNLSEETIAARTTFEDVAV